MHPLKSRIIEYSLSLQNTREDFPFDQQTWVGKVHDKLFILTDILDEEVRINLKCNPERAELLREEYEWILPGYHMSKKHWNTLVCHEAPQEWTLIKELIDHSYEEVVKTIPKSKRA